MIKTKSTLILSVLLAASINAGEIDGNAVIGSMVGAGVGTAVGSAAGGKDGAIIGGGVGGALGAAIGSKDTPKTSAAPVQTKTQVITKEKVIYVEKEGRGDKGKHKGHHKKHRKHPKHGRD